MLRQKVCRSVHLGTRHPSWTHGQTFSTVSCGLVEDGYAVYNCCWASSARLFSDPSPAELTAIFYCLTFEILLPGERER
jgi:hypothetical protein